MEQLLRIKSEIMQDNFSFQLKLKHKKSTGCFTLLFDQILEEFSHRIISIKKQKSELEKKYRQYRQTLISCINLSTVGIILIDDQNKIILMNPVTERLLGCNMLDAINADINFFINMFDEKNQPINLHGQKDNCNSDTITKPQKAVIKKNQQKQIPIIYNQVFLKTETEYFGSIISISISPDQIKSPELKEEQIKNLEKSLQSKMQSLCKAQSIVSNLIPEDLPKMANLNLAAFYLPCEEMGGDFFNIKYNQNKFIMIIGDCVGHGIEVSLVGVVCKMLTDKYLDLLFDNKLELFMQNLNKEIIDYFNKKIFVTLFTGVFNFETGNFKFANAKAEVPLVIRDSEALQLDQINDPHLGLSEKSVYQSYQIKLSNNDKLFFYSDSIREIPINDTKIFGFSGIKNLVLLFTDKFSDILKNIVNKIKVQNNGLPLEDDATIILLQYKKEANKLFKVSNIKDADKISEFLTEQLNSFDYDDKTINHILIGYEEIIMNALTHGMANSRNKFINVQININFDKALIKLNDIGEGFDWKNIPDPTTINYSNIKQEETGKYAHGRGIYLTHYYIDKVKFNAKGNAVDLLKYRKQQKTDFAINFLGIDHPFFSNSYSD